MGAVLSILPGWFRSQPQDVEVTYAMEDDRNAGVAAPTAREAVTAGYKAWSAAFDQKNFMAISLLYTRDCKVCPSGSRMAYGRQECLEGWQSLAKIGVDRIAFSDTMIELSGGDVSSAVESSNYHMYDEDNKVLDTGKHIMIWKQIFGKWFIYWHIFSSNKRQELGPKALVKEVCQKWEHAFFSRDFALLRTMYTSDCILCAPAWPQIEGSLPVQRFWARFPSMGVDHVERMAVNVEEMGPDHMVAELRYHMHDFQSSVIDVGKAIIILRKGEDHRWCIHSEVFNSDASTPKVSVDEQTEEPSLKINNPTGATDA